MRAATFDGTVMNARRICLKVISQVQRLSLIHSPKKPSEWIQTHIMGIIGVQPKNVRLKWGRLVSMDSPETSAIQA